LFLFWMEEGSSAFFSVVLCVVVVLSSVWSWSLVSFQFSIP